MDNTPNPPASGQDALVESLLSQAESEVGLSPAGTQAAGTEPPKGTNPGTPAPEPAPAPSAADTKPPPTADTPQTANPEAKPEDKPAPPPSPEAKPGDKAPTKYEREKQRAANQWEQIKEAKAALAREQRAWEAQKAGWMALQRAQAPKVITRGEYERAATHYEERARKLEADGSFEAADEQAQLAKLARQAAKEAPETAPNGGFNPAEFEQAQLASWQRTKDELPETLQTGSALNRAVLGLLKEHPELLHFSTDSPYLIARCADAALKAAGVPGLEEAKVKLTEHNAALEAKIKELESHLAVGAGGSASTVGKPTAFEDLPLDEAERLLVQEARTLK